MKPLTTRWAMAEDLIEIDELAYMTIDAEMIWQFASNEIGEMEIELKRILKKDLV